MDFNDIVDQAKKLATDHPEQAKAALDKAEEILDERTGGKYTDHIQKGGDTLEDRLGLPGEDRTVEEAASSQDRGRVEQPGGGKPVLPGE